jgi:hypothetical protein
MGGEGAIEVQGVNLVEGHPERPGFAHGGTQTGELMLIQRP